jgi:hypothetical protein
MIFGSHIIQFNTMIVTYLFPFLFTLLGCHSNSITPKVPAAAVSVPSETLNTSIGVDTFSKTIHVYVVPVPAKIGNGQDPHNNLYWGCGFGIRSYFKKSKEWKFLRSQKLNAIKLERLIFKHVSKNYYLIADAYDGQYIEQCTKDFLSACAGQKKDTIQINKMVIGIGGNAQLLSYIGHDGLMDFQLSETFVNTDNKKRNCIILACISKKYFAPHLKTTKANPLVWSTGLMSPEAYTLHDAISGYVLNETNDAIRNRAASAYAKYQKCSLKAARNLLVSGW